MWPAAFSTAAIVVSGSSSERGGSMRFHTLGNFGWLAPGTVMAEPLLKLRTVAGSGTLTLDERVTTIGPKRRILPPGRSSTMNGSVT
ncbi:hypothetical protein PPNSA23_47170 [Phyllobacterium phragmitis]|uniref:Uncharacterized protein n=1 Tax=Phyllobacterium phragmitis TaxID=2670329 RepID=A0ABQ0H782_9HYPH